MKVAIEFTAALTQGGGVGRSVYEMTAALLAAGQHDYTLFTAGRPPLPDDIAAFNPYVRSAPFSALTLTRLWHRLRVPLPVETFTGSQNLFFATDFTLPPTLPRTRTAVFIHDLTYVRVPDAAVPSLVRFLGKAVPRAVSRADVVIVNSEATKQDLIDIYGTPAEKIHPVRFGVHRRFTLPPKPRDYLNQKYGLAARPYIFAVGTIQPRKNYERLIAAYAQMRKWGEPALVIAGGKGWLESPIYEAVKAAKLESHVKFLGYVDDEDLPSLYAHAAAFAMPSLYEGFGLPVLEAMASGTPVVTSNLSSLPEAAGDAGILIDPYDTDAMANALWHVMSDSALRERLIIQGKSRAARYTWDRTAEDLLAAFDYALKA